MSSDQTPKFSSPESSQHSSTCSQNLDVVAESIMNEIACHLYGFQSSAPSASRSSASFDSQSQHYGGQSGEEHGYINSLTSTIIYSDPSNGHVPFDRFRVQVIELCRSIGYGEPNEVTRMRGGSFNRVIGLRFSARNPSNYVLRAPRNGVISDTAVEVKDQVAILQYLSQYKEIPAASVVAFDSTKNNAINSAYMLQVMIPGHTLENIYYDLPLDEKLQIITQIAELMLKLEAIPMHSPGRLVANTSVPAWSSNRFPSSETVGIGNFWIQKNFEQMRFLEKQPLSLLLRAMLKERIQWSEINDKYYIHVWEKLHQMVLEMEEVGVFRTTDSECILWHWDFAARNVMIDQFEMPHLEDPHQSRKSTLHPESSHSMVQSPSCQSIFGARENSGDVGFEYRSTDNKDRGQFSSDGLIDGTDQYTIDMEHKNPTHENGNRSAEGQKRKVGWMVTGIIDWDEIKSFPRIVARCPPQWLWSNYANRSTCNYDDDQPPKKGYTQDELTMKSHFDQIMQRADPTYVDDAYVRGPWIRRLAAITMDRIDSTEDFDMLNSQWTDYYGQIFKPIRAKKGVSSTVT